MTIFWASIEVHLEKAIMLVSDDGAEERASLAGFVQELGCTAPDEATMRMHIEAHVRAYDLGPGQVLDVVFREIERLELSEVEEEITADPTRRDHLLGDPRAVGVWYATGRTFYSEE